MLRRSPALFSVLALAALIATSGCTPRPAPEPAPTPTQTSLPDLSGLVPDSILATGEFASRDGEFTGSTEVVAGANGLFHLRILEGATSLPLIQVAGAVSPLPQDATCFDSGYRIGFPDFEPGAEYDWRYELSLFPGGDPTDLDEIVLTVMTDDPASGDCLTRMVARAPLHWEIEPTFPVPTAVDGGMRPGARRDGERAPGRL